MVSARTPEEPDSPVDIADEASQLRDARVNLAFDGLDDLIRLCLEDPERVPVFDGPVNLIMVDDRDPEWSADNLVRGAELLRNGEQILVHQMTHRSEGAEIGAVHGRG